MTDSMEAFFEEPSAIALVFRAGQSILDWHRYQAETVWRVQRLGLGGVAV